MTSGHSHNVGLRKFRRKEERDNDAHHPDGSACMSQDFVALKAARNQGRHQR